MLAALASEDRALLRPLLETRTFKPHERMFDGGDKADRIYFPLNCVVSLVIDFEDGTSYQCGMVGCEGVLGLGSAMSGQPVYARHMVQVEGEAAALPAQAFLAAYARSPSLRKTCSVYRDLFTAQLLQSVACNTGHSAEARFARWLLMLGDRLTTAEIPMTQEFVAQMLGISRPTVTLLAGSFQDAGLIRHRRGVITLLDPQAMREIACPCYEAIRRVYED